MGDRDPPYLLYLSYLLHLRRRAYHKANMAIYGIACSKKPGFISYNTRLTIATARAQIMTILVGQFTVLPTVIPLAISTFALETEAL